jgi:uncharacterized protein (DUF58 family)
MAGRSLSEWHARARAWQRGLAAFATSAARWAGPWVRRATSVVRPLGWFVLAIAIGGWLFGVLYGWVELLTIGASAGLLVVGCGLFMFGRAGLDVRIALQPQRTAVGLPANGQLTVRNVTERRLLPSRVDLPIGSGRASFSTPLLGAGDTHDDLFRIATDRRAIVPVGPALIVRADPVGLFGRVVSQSDGLLLYVHPKTVRVEGAGAGFLRDMEGSESADLSPSDLAFHSMREYEPGDDRRHVHWRTSARVGRLMVQQFIDTRRSQVLLTLNEDLQAYDDEDGFEVAVSALASIGQQVIREEQGRVVVSGTRVLPSPSATTLLDQLSGVSASAEGANLASTLALGSRLCPDASLVAIVTGRKTSVSEIRASALRFASAARVVVILVGRGPVGFQRVENILLFSIETLSDLPAVMNVVVHA